MSTHTSQRPTRIALQWPLIFLVLSFTAIPVELQPLTRSRIAEATQLSLDVPDVIANIVGYVPFGLVFASKGPWATAALSSGLSLLAETSQLFSKSRSPRLIDIATNVLGAFIGLVITWKWKPNWRSRPPEFLVGRMKATVATMLALAYLVFGARMAPIQIERAVSSVSRTPRLVWLETSPRGSSSPGQLEGWWTFEDTRGETVSDVSGGGLNGRLVNAPTFESGVAGRWLKLNGVNQYVDLGHPASLQLTGSETISAWINASSFPVDDAAVVSSHSGLGYQLDTTVDSGPRTVGFKLANAEGSLMARYGKTALSPNTWYYVAGVYDAQAQTLNVYVNGENDNGCLVGTVTNRQRISGMDVYIGRRASDSGFEFAGSIDDVRIYSRALTQAEIQSDFRSATGAQLTNAPTKVIDSADTRCPSREEAADSRSVGFVVMLGVLVSVAIIGLVPTVSRRTLFLSCVAVGFLLFPTLGETLPVGYKWTLPLLTLAGGASIVYSLNRPGMSQAIAD